MEEKTAGKTDRFAEIAQQGIDFAGKNLVIPEPQAKEDITLPLADGNKDAVSYPKKMDCNEELQKELAKQREYYKPFMQNLAPELKEYKKRQYLVDFDYRLQTEADAQDFSNVLNGGGDWEHVKVPHFWGPLGEQTAYYRTTFTLTKEDFAVGRLFMCFKAVDYKAHVFVNHSYVGSHEGFFAPFEFQITKHAKIGENTLVVICENDFVTGNIGDKIYAATGVGYDDPAVGWHHCPPGFGIYQDCYVEARPIVHMRDIFVRPNIHTKSAVCQFEIYNCENTTREITFEISVYGQNFEQTVFENVKYQPTSVLECGMGDSLTEAKRISEGSYKKPFFLKTNYRINTFRYEFTLPDMVLWELDTPYLYQIQIKIIDENGVVLDAMKGQFGMRSFTQDVETEGRKGMFYLNGRPIKLRGSNTMGNEQQCVFKKDFEQLRDDILLAKICNMNFLRITQRPVEPEVYDYCDKLGLMLQTDLPLFGCLRRNQFYEGIRQAGEMERLVRSHPCCILDTYINEPFPNANNQWHLSLGRDELEEFFKACDIAVHQQNPDRVIKAVDGDYDPPGPGLPDNHCYPGWYNGHGIDMGRLNKGYWMPVKDGWYYGCGEFGCEGLDPANVMRDHYPASWLPQTPEEEKTWTPRSIVNAQTGSFYYFFYEKPQSFDDWIFESRKHQAWATKTMAEAYRRDSRMITFAIHLFIDAFPAGWMKTIMDVERYPKPAYFIYREALTPLMVSLRSDRFKYFAGDTVCFEAWICNDKTTAPQNAVLTYQIEDENGTVVASGKQKAVVPIGTTKCQGDIKWHAPAVKDRKAYTIKLGLLDENGQVLHYNTNEFEVLSKWESPQNPVFIVGSKDGKAARLVREMGMQADFSNNFDGSSVILLDNYDSYLAEKAKLDSAVQNGAKAMFIELPNGTYDIMGTPIEIKMCSMMPVHFVAKNTGHKLVEGFDKADFRNWYDPDVDYITPVLDNTFFSSELRPILISGNTDASGTWVDANGAADKAVGYGTIGVCNVKLAGRVLHNPVAQRFAARLLAKD